MLKRAAPWSAAGSSGAEKRSKGNGWNEKVEIDGVEAFLACNQHPIVTMDSASPFHQHSSWLLQTALDTHTKADSLYDYVSDEAIEADLRKYGLGPDDVMLARVKKPEMKHVKAGGTSKRAAMFAVFLATCLQMGKQARNAIWEDLKVYNLQDSFGKLMIELGQLMSHDESVTEAPAKAKCDLSAYGLTLDFLSGGVPVLGMDKSSPFDGLASWLIQMATGSMGKADSLFKYSRDADLLRQCWKLGLAQEEAGLANLTVTGLEHISAVGRNGKRSIMMALVLALVVQNEVSVQKLGRDLATYDTSMEDSFVELLTSVQNEAAGSGGGFAASGSGSLWRGAKIGISVGDAVPRPSTSKRRKVQATDKTKAVLGVSGSFITEEETKAREERLQRFARHAGRDMSVAKDKAAGSSDEPMGNGSNEQLEKPYVRISDPQQKDDIRSVDVLEQAFQQVSEKWSKTRDWVVACDQLRSIRQELVVQKVRNKFTMEVHEFNARACLEVGDYGQYDKCAAFLEDLYNEEELRSQTESQEEFLAYRMLHYIALGREDELFLLMQKNAKVISAVTREGSLHLHTACVVREALRTGRVLRAIRLVDELPKAAGAGLKNLLAIVISHHQLMVLASVCSSHRGELQVSMLHRLLAGSKRVTQDGLAEALPEGLPIVTNAGNPQLVNLEATTMQATEYLDNHRNKLRRALQSEEHMKVFIRKTRSNGAS